MRKNGLTTEQHRAVATDLLDIQETTRQMFMLISVGYGVSKKITKKAERLWRDVMNLKSDMDGAFYGDGGKSPSPYYPVKGDEVSKF